MKTKIFTSILLLIISMILFSACEFEKIEIFKKHPDDDYPTDILPLATEFGADRLGCLINGEIFANSKNVPIYPRIDAYTYRFLKEETLYLYAYAKNKTYISLSVDANLVQINETIPLSRALYNTFYLEEDKYSRYISKENGKIYFTRFDTINHIISGRFVFTAHSADVNDRLYGDSIIHITEGRFDIKDYKDYR